MQQWSSRTLNDMAGNYTGVYTQMPVYHTNTYLGAGFKGKFMAGGWQNDWVVNVERQDFKRDRVNNVSNNNKYNVSGNIYTGSPTPKPNVFWDPITHQYTTVMYGWSVLDTITTPDKKVELTLGMHGHRVETTNYDNGSNSGLRRISDATSPVAAIVYKASPNLSFYADHTETFTEGSAVGTSYNNDGAMLPPTKTKQNEIGMKVKSGNLLHTLSLFDITQENAIDILVSEGPKYKVRALDGEERHRGIEYSVVGSLNKKWDAIFGVSYLHAYQNKTQGGVNDGRVVSGIPRLSGDLALIYKPDDSWNITGRINYTGTTSIRETSSYAAPIDIPSATILDLGASYKTKWGNNPVTISAMCYNVFDRDYWYAAGSNSIGLGAPRTFMVSAKFDF
ncbi:TonB-dependent siderophore receptor [uncultured Phascolarctobacterium sp.]|uniref:TonB-dependent receptor n=1 Tax=uncultured Phascolarctobacterium sp. TaxID=512296 RepID=UPI0025FDC877|nr:TonB-dependent receptor [uncultured Phascolarctobacterium sp.]